MIMSGRSVERTTNTNPLSGFDMPALDSPSSTRSSSPKAESPTGSFVRSIFGPVPSQNEVEYALAALQSFLHRLFGSVSATDGYQPKLSHDNPMLLQSPGLRRVYDAFRLLQVVPSVQRMVIAISTDKAVWDAVMTNDEVQNFQRSLQQVDMNKLLRPSESDEGQDMVSIILKWVFENMKLKAMELIQILRSVVSKVFQSSKQGKTNTVSENQFQEMICSVVLLTINVLMIVLVTRAYGE